MGRIVTGRIEMLLSSTRIMFALMLMACAAGANAECIPNAASYNTRASCIRDFSAQPLYVNRPDNKVRSVDDIRVTETRSEMSRVLGALGVSDPRATEFESPVARSVSELPWVDSSDWIRNPPEWLSDIKENRRRGAPVPLLHLWRSPRTETLIALGVSHRGIPGLYIARGVPY
jgi:hypothetical protein